MKKTILRTVLCSGLAVCAAACSESDFAGPETAGKGGFKPDIALNSEIITGSRPKGPSRAEAADITAADLGLRLIDAEGATVKSWDKLADFDPGQRFNVGEYTLEAFYGDGDSEGFESPWFLGSQKIKIEENKVTPVAITAELANSMVSLDYTEAFTSYMTSYDAEVHSAAGSTTAVAAGELRPVYVKAGLVEIYVNFTKPNGKGAKILSASFTAKPRHHYHVTFDLAEGAGDAVLKVTYDPMLDMIDEEIDLKDELLNLPAPEITAEGFTSGEAIRFVPGFAPDGQLKVNIIAQGKLARVNMTTRSASLLSQGWPAEINLVGAAAQSGKLASLGMQARGLYTNPDKMAVIDLTGVLSHITLVEGSDGITEITFKVVDAYGKASDDLTLRLENAPLAVALSNPSPIYVGSSEMEVDLAYNGGMPEGAVTIQYFNDRGTWSAATASYTTAGEGLFRATVTGLPADARDVQLRAVTASLTSEAITVERTPVTIAATAADTDVFARHATIGASLGARAAGVDIPGLLKNATLMISSDGGSTFAPASATVDGPAFNVTGLTPGTAYKARIEIPGMDASNEVSFTTETTPQLPNAGMETWYRWKKANSQCYWFIDYPGSDDKAVWGTVNALTTSDGGSGLFDTNKYAYVAYSGTYETSDSHSGSKAACIATVGWGSGSTAFGESTANCKHLTAGELYLGHYDSASKSAVYDGIDFNGRPAALSFWYKYKAYNAADFGWAEIRVLDESGAVIASATKKLSASDYIQAEIPITYTRGAKKASRITVIFKSTGDPQRLAINSSNVKGPPAANLSDGRYIGSELFIDDIELIY